VSDTDVRSTKLEWIRDGSNWLVGVSTGALVLSGTYFFDRFNRAPAAPGLLVTAWVSLSISALFGVLTSFSAWKDLKSKSWETFPLGGWVRHCYTVMMWAFLMGYVCLAIALITSVLASARETTSAKGPELFLAGSPLPPFVSASAEAPADLVQGVCGVRQALQNSDVQAVLVVGRHDRRELQLAAAKRFGSNLALAQQRAERVATLLADATVCPSQVAAHVLTLVAGPRHLDPPPGDDRASVEAKLADDRRVEVYGLRGRPSAVSAQDPGSRPR
jgi:hypothetical protein